jgi:UDP-N-acetylmuramate dehydrogenase
LEHLKQVNLKKWNSFGIAEIADDCWRLGESSEVPALLQILRQNNALGGSSSSARESLADAPLLIGGGSNLLITGPVHRPIIRFEFKQISILSQDQDHALVRAEAGANWHDFVLWCLEHQLYGLENLSLIPGTVGASPVQNIGAYGVEMKDSFHRIEAYDARSLATQETNDPITLTASDCQFSYRDSVFKRTPGLWISSVCFKLSKSPKLKLDYGDIKDWLKDERITRPSPKDVADAVIAIRSSKLPDPQKLGNAGSFFKNPSLKATQIDGLLLKHPTLPHYPSPKTDERKVPAAWLIDQCGLKGFREGDAGVHEAHALVLVNYGRARGKDIFALAQKIQNTVHSRFGIQLEPEPIII